MSNATINPARRTSAVRSEVRGASSVPNPGSNAYVEWSDYLDYLNRNGVRGLGAGPIGPSGGAAPEAVPIARRVRPIGTAAAAGGASPAAVTVTLSPEAIGAIKKFLNTMRPGGSQFFDAELAGNTIARILRYYHPQLRGVNGLGSWLSDALKGKGDNPLSKVVGAVTGVVSAVTGGGGGSSPTIQVPPLAANPWATVGPTMTPQQQSSQPLVTQLSPSAPQSPTVIVTEQQSDAGKIALFGGLGLAALLLVVMLARK